jgi:hypothetical protein
MADRIGPELDLVGSGEVKDGLPGVLEAIGPATGNAVGRIAPAEFIHKLPAPLPPMRKHQILYIQASLTILRVLFDVQEVGAVRSQNVTDYVSDLLEPGDVLVRRDWLEAASGVVLALGRVRRRRDYQVHLPAAKNAPYGANVAAVSATRRVD